MNRRIIKHASIASALALVVAACATTPPPAAVLSPPTGPCDAQLVLEDVLLLEAPRGSSAKRMAAPLLAETPCWADPVSSENVPYVVAQLPETEGQVLLTVSSVNEAIRMLALNVRMLNAEGAVVRSFERDNYLSLGDGYSLQIRPREGETMVLVTSAPELVGKSIESIHMGIVTNSTYTQYGSFNYSSGMDSNHSRQFSYEGSVVFQILNTP